MGGDIKLSSNFELSAQKPLDDRLTVASIGERDTIPLIRRYDRMFVAVQGGDNYQLRLGTVDNDLANNANWVNTNLVAWSNITGAPTDYEPAPHTHDRIVYVNQNADVVFNISGTTPAQYYYTQNGTVSFQFDVLQDKYVNIIQADSSSYTHLSIYKNNELVYDSDLQFKVIDFNSGANSGYELERSVLFSAGNTYKFELTHSGTSFRAYPTNKTDYYEDVLSYPFVSNYSLYFTDNNGVSQDFADKVIFQTLRYNKFASVIAKQGNIDVIAEKTTIYSKLTLKKDLVVEGNIIQQGAAYETHAEQLYSTKDVLIMREGAVTGLATNELSGFRIFKYNGTDNLFFGADANGIARVGDENGTLQALATREDTPLNGGFAQWNESLERFDTVNLNAIYYTKTETDNLLVDKEPAFTKNTAFNKNFGTAAGTVAEGNHNHDSRYYTESEIDTKFGALPWRSVTNGIYYASGKVGVGTSLASAVFHAKTATSTKALLAQTITNLITASGVNYFIAAESNIQAAIQISSGVTDSGYRMAHNIHAFDTLGELKGQLEGLYGIRIQYGINNAGSTGTINNVYGIRFQHLQAAGTQNNVFSIYSPDNKPILYHQGSAGFGTPIPTEKIDVAGNIKTTGYLKLYSGTAIKAWLDYGASRSGAVNLFNNTSDSGLSIYDDGHSVFGGTVTATDFIPTSDRILKENIKPLKASIKGLKPVSFNYKKGDKSTLYGFIAQDLKKTHPELVVGTGKKLENGEIDYYRIKQSSIIAILVKEVKKNKKKLRKIKKKLNKLNKHGIR